MKNPSEERMNRKEKTDTNGLKINSNFTPMNMVRPLIRGRCPQLHSFGNMVFRPQLHLVIFNDARDILFRMRK